MYKLCRGLFIAGEAVTGKLVFVFVCAGKMGSAYYYYYYYYVELQMTSICFVALAT